MKRLNLNTLNKVLGAALLSSTCLYGTLLTPANASLFPQKVDQACMAERAGFALNCTANDVSVSKVDNIKNIDNPNDPVECIEGQSVTFLADVTITTTASERYDYSVYLPEGNWSAQDNNPNNECSILVGRTNGPGVNIDKDACADISKGKGFSPTHLYAAEEITLFCRDDDNSGKAEFNYCAAWNNKADANDCSENNPSVPGTPSKCRCDAFDIDVFIKPNPPAVIKTLKSANTLTEPGGAYTFEVSFTNPNAETSLFITSLSDEIDTGADGSFETSIDLWGSTVIAGAADGIYLTASNCTQPANGGEIVPSGSYSCQFTVNIVDSDLPNDQSPELYNDLIKLALEDKNGTAVPDSDSCEPVGGVTGEHCSSVQQVKVTNLPPTITVEKTANPTQVPESGGNVTYTVKVTNTSANFDSPMTLTSLMDDQFGDLNGKGTCTTSGMIAFMGYYQCTFTEFISGTGAGSHTNIVTATAIDNEADEATNSDAETVLINDIPSSITLEKTANPNSVEETGDDPAITRQVAYTFLFGVNASGVDPVTFSSLSDDKFGTLTGNCMVSMKNGLPIPATPLLGFILNPGENASCVMSKGLTGASGDSHVNVATINGTDADGQAVQAVDDATVTFTPVAPAVDMKFAASLLVVIEMNNTGIKNVNLTKLLVFGENAFVGGEFEHFKLLNSGGTFNGVSYGACEENHLLGFVGSGTDSYTCAFTIEAEPGLDSIEDINLEDTHAISVELKDNLENTVTQDVSIAVQVLQ